MLSRFEKLYLCSQFLLVLVGILAGCAALFSLNLLRGTLIATQDQASAAKVQAQSALTAAQTAQQQLLLSERPWIKVKHRIVKPLTFNVGRTNRVTSTIIEDTLENVGQSVALDVLSWEDIVPMDSGIDTQAACTLQNQACNARRHPDPRSPSGYMLFPHDPFVEDSMIGPSMETVVKAAKASPKGLEGKVAFVMVGCISYRIPFEASDAPRHETRFTYTLGKPVGGAVQPFVEPHGIHPEIQLIAFPQGFSAD